MGFDEQLKLLLEDRANDAHISPEAWATIQDKVRRRPYGRALAVVASVAIVAGVAIAVPKLLQRGPVRIQTPATNPSSGDPTPADVASPDFSNAAFWPRSDIASARQYQSEVDGGVDDWMYDPEKVAEHFAMAFIGWKSAELQHDVAFDQVGELRRATFHLRPILAAGNGRPGTLHTIALVSLPGVSKPTWYVSQLTSDNLSLSEPKQSAQAVSPLAVKGEGVGFEATLNPEIRDDTGNKLHPRRGKDPGYIMAGSTEPQPFTASLAFDPPQTPRGIFVLVSSSGLEGPSGDWTIRRLLFETAALESASIVADDRADKALRCFFTARLDRNLAAAKGCMTARFASSWTEESFAGTSNPHITRFTVLKDVSRTASKAQVIVRTYESSTRSEADSYSEDSFVIIEDVDRFFVDSWIRGDTTTIQAPTSVTVFFRAVGSDACPGDAGYDSGWTSQKRVISKEGPGTQALQELFTGPLKQGSDTPVSALPLASRLITLKIESGVARVDVSRATGAGGGSCGMGIRLDQIRKTLLRFPTVKEVVISAEGDPNTFQP